MMTAGRRARVRSVVIGFVAFVVFMHTVAYFVVGTSANAAPDKHAMIAITRDAVAVVAVDDFAGDGIDDARVLRALRSRSHPRVAGGGA